MARQGMAGQGTADQEGIERHNVNLSRRVWGELKLRSFQEGMSASELVAYVLERYLQGYHTLRLPRYQPRAGDEDRLGRTVFIPAEIWKEAQRFAGSAGTSISALIEYLLKQYLGMLAESEQEPAPPLKGETLRIGEERVYLGEHPIKIDLKTGKPSEE